MRIMAGKGNANRRMGAFWERQAAEYLEQKGYQILERNFCSYFGEIDIIARQGDYLVFVEVKYRREGSPVHALESIDSGKQRRKIRPAVSTSLASRAARLPTLRMPSLMCEQSEGD